MNAHAIAPRHPAAPRLRILLVYPEIPPTYWNMCYALHLVGKQATLPPLGLITVAAMLPADCDVSLVDMNVEPLTAERVAAADLVFTSSMLVQKSSHEQVVRLCNTLGKPVLAGGPYPTSSHDEIEGVQHFVLGEAEEVLGRFLADLRAGRAEKLYTAARRPDLSASPVPRFDLLRPGAYVSMAVQFSRGCPHDCEFCNVVSLFGRASRAKMPAQLLAELDAVYATGHRGSLFVVDDNFIGNKREVRRLLPVVAAWQEARGYPFRLFTEATVALARDEGLLDLLVRAGFNSVFLGIETPVAESLREAHKTQNLGVDLADGVRRIQRRGIEVMAGFIVGFDGDPDDVFDRQLAFIERAGIPMAMVGLLTALPHTRLHRRLAAEGRLLATGDGNNTHDLRLTFVPKMDPGKLVAGYRRLLAELYNPARYFGRCLALLRRMQPHATSSRALGLRELRAFVASLAVQGSSRYRRAYWGYLARALLTKPRLFAEAVTMAIKGHHFFAMTERLVPELAADTPRRAPAAPASLLDAGRALMGRALAPAASPPHATPDERPVHPGITAAGGASPSRYGARAPKGKRGLRTISASRLSRHRDSSS